MQVHRDPHTGDAGALEWEELPSLSGVVLRRHVPPASYAAYTQSPVFSSFGTLAP